MTVPWYWLGLFWISLLVNLRAIVRLLVDWKGMLTTLRFVEDAYRRVDTLPDEARLEREVGAPVFVQLVPAWEEPDITTTLAELLAARYPHGRLHIVVTTKEEEDRAPNPGMSAPTAELVRRFRAELPPYQQKMLSLVTLPGPGRKAHQLNWALRPEFLRTLLGDNHDPESVWVGVSDADSIPDRDIYRWLAAQVLAGTASVAYQGVTLSLANFEALTVSGRVCALQQSSIFVRVSIARLINEGRRVRWFAAFRRRVPRLAAVIRPVFEFCFRRSQICLGHNQFVRLDVLRALGGFSTSGATEDSTLGYALAARGVLAAPLPLIELNDMPEGKEKMVRQNARWYKGVLDDVAFLWATWRARRSAFNLAQLCRHVGNKVIEWPIAAVMYPVLGTPAWLIAKWYFTDRPWLLFLGIGFPVVSLWLGIWVGGLVTQELIGGLTPYGPRPVNVAATSLWARISYTFRTQTYWLLATRGAWRVLWGLVRTGHYEPGKTDRVMRRHLRPSVDTPLTSR